MPFSLPESGAKNASMDIKQDLVGPTPPPRMRGSSGRLDWDRSSAASPIRASPLTPSPSRKSNLAEEALYARLISCLAILEIVG